MVGEIGKLGTSLSPGIFFLPENKFLSCYTEMLKFTDFARAAAELWLWKSSETEDM
jgi:hypothetical protein